MEVDDFLPSTSIKTASFMEVGDFPIALSIKSPVFMEVGGWFIALSIKSPVFMDRMLFRSPVKPGMTGQPVPDYTCITHPSVATLILTEEGSAVLRARRQEWRVEPVVKTSSMMSTCLGGPDSRTACILS